MFGFVYWQHKDVYTSQLVRQVIGYYRIVVAPVTKANPIHLDDKDLIFFAVLFCTCVVARDASNDIVPSALDAGFAQNLGISFDSANSIMIEMRVRHQNEVGFQLWKALVEPAPP